MVATRGSSRQPAARSKIAVGSASTSDEEGSSSTSTTTESDVSSLSPPRGSTRSSTRSSGSGSSGSNRGRGKGSSRGRGKTGTRGRSVGSSGGKASSSSSSSSSSNGGSSSSDGSSVMTRKRRLVHEVEAHLAIGIAPYWEGGLDLEGETDREEEGTPRRSRRGEARRKYEDATGLLPRHQPKMEVNLPPMVNTREGKLLTVEVFGSGVLTVLLANDRGARVGHCSSGYVCGYPVPRGKEGNSWCQTPVRASLDSRLACMHHSHRRVGSAGHSREQLHYMMLADEFYDQQTGKICWRRVVSYLRIRELPLELAQRRQVLTAGGRAVAVTDTKIALHGFEQCLFFWLAACRLTRRGYHFTLVTHASKTELKEFLTGLRATAAWPPPSPASSPFVCVDDKRSNVSASLYASGYDEVCRMF